MMMVMMIIIIIIIIIICEDHKLLLNIGNLRLISHRIYATKFNHNSFN